MSFYLKIGDLLHNPENGAFGLVTKITKMYFHFHLMSAELEGDEIVISKDKAKKAKVYESIDNKIINLHLGKTKNRRKRKRSYSTVEIETGG